MSMVRSACRPSPPPGVFAETYEPVRNRRRTKRMDVDHDELENVTRPTRSASLRPSTTQLGKSSR